MELRLNKRARKIETQAEMSKIIEATSTFPLMVQLVARNSLRNEIQIDSTTRQGIACFLRTVTLSRAIRLARITR